MSATTGSLLRQDPLTVASAIRRQPAPAANKRDSLPNLRERGIRNESSRGRGAPPARGRGAGPARGRGTGRAGRERENKTVEDLDRELEEFMASGSTGVSRGPDVPEACMHR